MALLAIAAPATAAKFTMQLVAAPEQQSRMQGGIAAVDNSSAGSSVRLIQAEGDLKKRGSVAVLVMNQGDKPFNFGPENVTATLADGTVVEIITYERLVREEKKRQTWAAIAGGLAAAGNSMSAANSGYYSGTATYSGSTFGSFGSTPYNSYSSGRATVSGYNAGQAQLARSVANAQNQANFERMAEQNASNMQALKSYMRTTTVDPQQMFGGSVTFELPKTVHKGNGDVPLRFAVTINGEAHKFDAVLKRR
ncbi:MAG TPA: hypothetical protein VFS49_04240 [Croceibacterium sp.]|nr:hypothetical protein [Croceibacterium sp.]